ncbi:M16 family metallopeptidase [Desulfovibrio inopinatus]|uniref:M16 family metallopeptidase n=1 Tax=Desulfovibrio inopinatus TaxID=102109 RepID=UPI0004206BB8|nr:pitrilysin family protein [Desulfovibrio inopinatus]
MKRFFLHLIGVLAMLQVLSPLGESIALAAPDQIPDDVHVTVLENGMTVVVMEDDRFPLAAVRLFVHTGSAFETPKQAGISHLLEHMVFKPTNTRNGGDAAQEIERVGGDVNAATSFDYTVFIADVPDAHVKLPLEVFKDMIFSAKFDPKELEREKQVVLSELARGEDNPSNRLFKTLQSEVFSGTTYGWPIIGFKDSVSAITPEDLRQYIREHYQPQSMLLAVCGRIKAENVVATAQEVFGDLKNTHVQTPPPHIAAESLPVGPKVVVEAGKWNKVYLHAVFPIPGMNTANEAGLELLAQLLGGDRTSKLYRMFKYDKRLVDSISMSSLTLERAGLLYIDATLDEANLETFWKDLIAELSSLSADSFTQEEIDRGKLNIEDSLFTAKETLGGLTMKLGYFRFFGYGPNGEANYLTNLANVDRAELEKLITTYVRPSALFVSALVPAKDGADTASLTQSMEDTVRQAIPQKQQSVTHVQKDTAHKEIVDLGQGRRVIFLPDPTLPYAAVSLVYNGGDALLDEKTQGLADLAARALTRGTSTRSATEIEDLLSDRASAIWASNGRDSFAVTAKYPARFGSEVLDQFKATVLHPAFVDKEVLLSIQNQLASIRSQNDQPMGLAFRQLFPFLFASGHYSYYRQGIPDEVKAYTPAQLVSFWEKQRSMPWALAVCGQFDQDEILTLARELAAAQENVTPFAFTAPQWSNNHEKKLTLQDRNQTHILKIYPVPGSESPDTPALKLLKTALAGQGGILFRELRDKQGLGYTVTAMLWQAKEGGFLAFYIGTSPEKATQAMAGFDDVVQFVMQNDLPAEEIERAKNLLLGDYYRNHQSLRSRSEEAARLVGRGFDVDRNQKVIEEAEKLTPVDVRNAAKRFFDENQPYIMQIVP